MQAVAVQRHGGRRLARAAPRPCPESPADLVRHVKGCHGGQGECSVPPRNKRGSVCLSLPGGHSSQLVINRKKPRNQGKSPVLPYTHGGRAKAWCLIIHAEAAVSPPHTRESFCLSIEEMRVQNAFGVVASNI